MTLALAQLVFLYHLKAYLYGFILCHGSKFLGAPFMAKSGFKSKKKISHIASPGISRGVDKVEFADWSEVNQIFYYG